MRNNYKLTPQAYKSILILAKSLGPFQRRDKNGELMFRKVTHFKGTNGWAPEGDYKNHIQRDSEPIMVNHEVNLVEVYQKYGLPGIKAYAEFFEDLKKEKKDAEQGI